MLSREDISDETKKEMFSESLLECRHLDWQTELTFFFNTDRSLYLFCHTELT
jgi:hypothetical protein